MRRRVLVPLAAALAVSLLAVGAMAALAGASVPAKGAPACSGGTKKAATKAIAKTWDTILNGTNTATIEQKAALVQGTQDPAFHQVFSDVAARFGALLKTTTVKVKKVACETAKTAKVTYDLVPATGGAPLLPGRMGDAVIDAGKWKASKGTVCDLFSLADASLTENPACTSPA